MPLPEKILVTLTQCSGQSSGSPPPQHILNHVTNSDPPKYEADAEGDFSFAECTSIVDGNGNVTTYELVLRYDDSTSPCYGWQVLRRDPAAADPTGDYCTKSGGGVNCSDSQANAVTAC